MKRVLRRSSLTRTERDLSCRPLHTVPQNKRGGTEHESVIHCCFYSLLGWHRSIVHGSPQLTEYDKGLEIGERAEGLHFSWQAFCQLFDFGILVRLSACSFK